MPVLIWGALLVGIVLSLLVASFAEFGSAYPSVAGCLVLATKLGGPKYGRICVRFADRETFLLLTTTLGLHDWWHSRFGIPCYSCLPHHCSFSVLYGHGHGNAPRLATYEVAKLPHLPGGEYSYHLHLFQRVEIPWSHGYSRR